MYLDFTLLIKFFLINLTISGYFLTIFFAVALKCKTGLSSKPDFSEPKYFV
jgi:hypothetical protein